MLVAVFHVIDRDGYRIRDQEVLRYIQEVSIHFVGRVFVFLLIFFTRRLIAI